MLFLFGCSSSKPYTLVAPLPPVSQQSRMVAATIDVNNYQCNVRIVTLDSVKPWTPLCLVMKDQSTYKRFTIGGKEVDIGAVDNNFKVLSSDLPVMPASAAATSHNPAASGNTAPVASSFANTAATAGSPAFPTVWNMEPYPGQVVLQGQNTGFMVTNATLTINGSKGILDVTYKVGRAPLHIECTVVANHKGDFTLMFNPTELATLSPSARYYIPMNSEGAGISGNIWDSTGFDTWTPSLPPRWIAVSNSSD
ncbi:MAG: hypothetical protein ACRER7_03565 [Gammaproteobacteria bacterium]